MFECVGGGLGGGEGSVLISMGFSFHASLPTGYPGATPLALLHAGVIGGGRVMLTLSCGLEIFIFAYVIHLVQVANFVNAVYLPCPHGCWYK